MLLIVNPKATTVSSRLKNLIMYALRGRYDVEFVETEARNHATELDREAVGAGFDLVVAFGGTARSTRPPTAWPARTSAVDAAGRLHQRGLPHARHPDRRDRRHRAPAALADGPRPRRIDLGSVNGRYFVSSSGVGHRRRHTRWVDARPRLKARRAYLWFAIAAVKLPARYRASPRAGVEVGRAAGRGHQRVRSELGPVHILRRARCASARRSRSTAARCR